MDQATDLLLSRHVASDNLAKVCKYLVISPAPGADQFLKAVGDKNPHRDMQAFARYCGTRRLHEQAKRLVPANPAEADRMDQAAEQQFERLAAEFGDVRVPAITPPEVLSEAIKRDLFEIRHLSVGKPAPEIESEDVDGKPMKLSDQHGKVVMLVFWGYWCGDCRAMLPHERAIAKRMEGKPFALIGVNSDRTRDVVKKAREKEHITWRSWWDDGTRRGRISSAWNIHFWPTIYVIDAKGIIRYKDVTHQALDEALDSLVKEAR
jgi:thiol-disulfide isomerase/thioredoxin